MFTLKEIRNSPSQMFYNYTCNCIKKMTPAKVFSREVTKILETPFLQNTSGFETFKEITRYSTKTMRPFILKIKALYFFSQLLSSAIFEHDKHVMITILSKHIEDICYESIHDNKKKAKI